METAAANPPRTAPWVPIAAGLGLTLLLAVSAAWQSWQRNESLAQLTHPVAYFVAIWIGYALWIAIVLIIGRWAQRWPLQGGAGRTHWLRHMALSLAVGFTHLLVDTLLLWISLGGAFALVNGYGEKLLRWLPYEVLAYWACLSLYSLLRQGSAAPEEPRFLDRLSVKQADEVKLVPVAQIDYLEACDNYVKVWCGQERQLIKDSLSRLETRLDPATFCRIHRSFIVNLGVVEGVTKTTDSPPAVQLRHGRSLPVSRRRRAQLNKCLANR